MSKKYELSKADKYMIAQLYLKGFSSDDVYYTLKRNRIHIPRQEIRDYLKGKQIKNNRGKLSNYADKIKEKYNAAKSPVKNKREGNPVLSWKEYREQKKGLQNNYIKSTAIQLFNTNQINPKNIPEEFKKYKKFVKWNEYKQDWESP